MKKWHGSWLMFVLKGLGLGFESNFLWGYSGPQLE